MSQSKTFKKSPELAHDGDFNQTHLVSESFRSVTEFTTYSLTVPGVIFRFCPIHNTLGNDTVI